MEQPQFMNMTVAEVCGGLENFLKLPVYDLDNSKLHEFHDYIDFIKHDKMEYPIMRGIDKWNRIFLTLKLKFHSINNPDKIKKITVVLFQRYTDNKMWVSASNPSCHHDSFLNPLYERDYDKKLKELLDMNTLINVWNPYYGIYGTYVLG